MMFIKEMYENIYISKMKIRWEEIQQSELVPWLWYNQSLSDLVGGGEKKSENVKEDY